VEQVEVLEPIKLLLIHKLAVLVVLEFMALEALAVLLNLL
jgi:hypothetical protein